MSALWSKLLVSFGKLVEKACQGAIIKAGRKL